MRNAFCMWQSVIENISWLRCRMPVSILKSTSNWLKEHTIAGQEAGGFVCAYCCSCLAASSTNVERNKSVNPECL